MSVMNAEDQPLSFLLYRMVTVLRPCLTAELAKAGISLAEFVCLRTLSDHPGLTSAQLARHTNVSAQAMSQVLRHLQDIGAVTRPGEVPRGRPLPARITRAGRVMLKRAEAAARTADELALRDFTPQERRDLKTLLYRAGSDQLE